jgi:heptosyltransferase-1
MLKILLVKTSSMGDVIHNLPVATDIRTHFPDAHIDWVAEEGFAAIPALHPGVGQVLPVAIRRWRKAPLSRRTRTEIGAFIGGLRARRYDLVIDTQGLIKSAVIARLANGTRCGYDRKSAREPLAAMFYDHAIAVDKSLHAVERNRILAGRALGYAPGVLDYGIAAPDLPLPWLPDHPFAVLLHATSRVSKLWPEADWVALGRRFSEQGLACVLPWGSPEEEARSRRLAGGIPDAVIPPGMALDQAAALLSRARAVVGVDTGLVHLAAALKVPVVALYCGSDPGLTGVYSAGPGVNLGKAGSPPSLADAVAALEGLLQP